MDLLAVFARWPHPGRVKTRLSPALPPELACDLQQAMLEDVLAAARGAHADRRWICWADAPRERPRVDGFDVADQRGDDLGARLAAAFDEGLGQSSRMVVIGSDAPEMTSTLVDQAFAALGTRDLVLAPTPDGGFSLIGLSRREAGWLREHPWSTPLALASVESRAKALGLETAVLEPVADIDTSADLASLIGRLLASESAPATRAALETMGLLRRLG